MTIRSCDIIYRVLVFFFQAEDGIRDLVRSRGLGDVYKRQLEKLTEVVDGKPRFISQPPLIVPINELFSSDQALSLIHI